MGITISTVFTTPAHNVKRNEDIIPRPPVLDLLTRCNDCSRRFMAQDIPDRDPATFEPSIIPLPGMPITPANSAGLDIDEDILWPRLGCWVLFYLKRFTIPSERRSSHDAVTGKYECCSILMLGHRYHLTYVLDFYG